MKKALVALLFSAFFSVSAKAEAYSPLGHVQRGLNDFLNRENLIVLGAGTAATLVAVFTLDSSVQRYFAGRDRLGGFEKFGNFWGNGIPGGSMGAGTLGYGLIFKKTREVNAGEAHLEALAVNFIVTEALKYPVHRKRPDGSDFRSFPSTHSSTAFATAASLMDMYGPWAGVPALLLGAGTAASRMAVNKHWLSDTIFGAALGYAFGHAYALHHQGEASSSKVAVLPYFDARSEFGLVGRMSL